MPNFAHKFSMPCSEKQFNSAEINGVPLRTKLAELGYAIDKLKFFPGKLYIGSFYKSDPLQLGVIKSLYDGERRAVNEWNPVLFYKLACQLDGSLVTVNEWYKEPLGRIYQCNELVKEWVRTNLPERFSVAFKTNDVKKATFEELVKSEIPEQVVIVDDFNTFKNPVLWDSQKTDHENLRDILIPQLPTTTTSKNMNFLEICTALASDTPVFWGHCTAEEIHCQKAIIELVGKSSATIEGSINPIPFENIFSSQEEFLRYTLQELTK